MLFEDAVLFEFFHQFPSAAHGGLRGSCIILVTGDDHPFQLQLSCVFQAKLQLLCSVSFSAFGRPDTIGDMSAAFQLFCQGMMNLDASDQLSVGFSP